MEKVVRRSQLCEVGVLCVLQMGGEMFVF
uniref:Uncharacterized protein n=1 Tax=Arundo donax TaxID=35708 RepID=A0A0A9B874_ARUDO